MKNICAKMVRKWEEKKFAKTFDSIVGRAQLLENILTGDETWS